jgi:hypothetical protein
MDGAFAEASTGSIGSAVAAAVRGAQAGVVLMIFHSSAVDPSAHCCSGLEVLGGACKIVEVLDSTMNSVG